MNIQKIYEIRIRVNRPITVNHAGKYIYLSRYGLCHDVKKALVCTHLDISNCLYKAGEYSIYSKEEQIKKGYLTASGGVRIGLAGEYVLEGGQVLSLRNVTSLCIRIPHEVLGSGEAIYRSCMSDRIRSTLIMSPPGMGKTTILRDLGRIIGEKTLKNVLICDERGEISIGNVGKTCDVIAYADKKTAFEMGIRAMKPDVIITDELSFDDCIALKQVINAGITVLASAHFSDINYVKEPFLGLFERYVLLADEIGMMARIFDEKGMEYAPC